jgi:hypothetical protein
MHVKNETSDQDPIKICLYRAEDWKPDWIPVGAGVFTVAKGENHHWEPVPGEGLPSYHVKVFHPSLIDGNLCDRDDVPVGESLIVRGGNGSYEIKPVA